MLWGANMADNHPLLVPRVLGDGGPSRVIVVDPRVTKTAMIADTHLPVRPRGDVALLNGVLAVLLEEDLVDLDAVRGHVDGLDDLVAHLAGWTVERAADESGIDADAIRDLARTIAGAERCTIAWTMGVNHSVQGTQTVTLINTLALLTGNVGLPGASPFSITGQCNAMGTREAGFTASMPGYRAYDDPAARAELAALWGIDEARLPAARGRAYPDIVNAVMSTATIKGLWIIATNPPVSFPNREVLEDALGRLDLLVVQDGFETPTTALADVVLPGGDLGREGRHVHQQRAPGVAGPDRGRAAGRGPQRLRHLPRPGRAAGAAPTSCSPAGRRPTTPSPSGDACRPAGRATTAASPTTASTQVGGVFSGRAPRATTCRSAAPPGCTATGSFNRPDGRALVLPVEPEPIRDAPRPEFPFLLNTGRTVEHWHTRTKTGRIPILEGLSPEAWVEMHPADAAALGVRAGDWVRVGLVAGRGRADPGPGDRHRPAGRGVHPLPLGRALRQPPDRRRVRPDQPRAQLQAVRGEGRAATDPGRPLVVRRLTRPDRRRVGTTSTGGHRPRSPTRSARCEPRPRRSPPRRAPIRGARATCRPRGRR